MKFVKKIFFWGLLFVGLCLAFVFWSNYKIENASKDFVFNDLNKIPNQKVGLLLGTSKTLSNGNPNAYYVRRIEATAELYKAGKIKYVIVSGDNSVKNYNETEDMKFSLMEKGIPESHIFEDFAGFRTLDSVVRAKEIFGQDSITVISQKFHNERAIFLAQKNGITAYGYNAKDVNKAYGFKTNLREKFARAKVFVDLLFGIEPKFGGEKIVIP